MAILPWRRYLEQHIRDPQERQKLADLMGVNPITLTRWASYSPDPSAGNGKGPRPQRQSLRKFVETIPTEDRKGIIASILEEFHQEITEEELLSRTAIFIPSICYELVMEAAALYTGLQRITTIVGLLLEHAPSQVDPEQLGISITIAQCCTPPASEQKVRSLRELFRVGTPPWAREREERHFFLGSESLAAEAVKSSVTVVIANTRGYSGWLPYQSSSIHEMSVAASPIQRRNTVAGCLLFSSTRPYFFTQERIALIEKYCYLAQVMFDDNEFFGRSCISFSPMPTPDIQKPYLRLFRKYVEQQEDRQRQRNGRETDPLQAEIAAIQRIENDLLALSNKKNREVPR